MQVRRPFLPVLCILGLALAALVVPGTARAGQLDKDLLRNSARVLYYLDAQGYRNVGVLPFLVQRGSRPASHDAAPLALDLTSRLENGLILGQDHRGKTIGIIRNAMTTANRGEVGPYQSSKAALQKLFAQDYDLAWGRTTVRADAFLTGTVVNAGKDRSRTQVVIHCFDAKKSLKAGKPVLDKVCAFEVGTDESLLADLGYNYALSPLALKRAAAPPNRSRIIVDQIVRDEGEELPPIEAPEGAAPPTPGSIGGFGLDLFFKDDKQKIVPLKQPGEGRQAPTFQMPAIPDGEEVVLSLTRNDDSDQTLGVVIKVNGQSLWLREDKEPEQCRKWIFGPAFKGKANRFRGFYTGLNGKNLLRFRSLTAGDSQRKASELGNRVGWIDITVFAPQTERPAEMSRADMISTRVVPTARGASLREVQTQLEKANNVRVKQVRLGSLARKADVLDADPEPVEGPKIGTASLPNPVRIAHLSIRYWERPLDD
jgi:hypothetical protein